MGQSANRNDVATNTTLNTCTWVFNNVTGKLQRRSTLMGRLGDGFRRDMIRCLGERTGEAQHHIWSIAMVTLNID
ncbi:hypothetical protein ACEQUB_01633 [Ralstonia syzygii]